jgi:hypothetical protein
VKKDIANSQMGKLRQRPQHVGPRAFIVFFCTCIITGFVFHETQHAAFFADRIDQILRQAREEVEKLRNSDYCSSFVQEADDELAAFAHRRRSQRPKKSVTGSHYQLKEVILQNLSYKKLQNI